MRRWGGNGTAQGAKPCLSRRATTASAPGPVLSERITELLRGTCSAAVGGATLPPALRGGIFPVGLLRGSDPSRVSHLNQAGLNPPGGRRFQPGLGRPGAAPAPPPPVCPGTRITAAALGLADGGGRGASQRPAARPGRPQGRRLEDGQPERPGPDTCGESEERTRGARVLPPQVPGSERAGRRRTVAPTRSPALSNRARTGAGAMARRGRAPSGFSFRRRPRPRRSAACRPGGATARPEPAPGPAPEASPPAPRPPLGSQRAYLGVREALSPTSARRRPGTADFRRQKGGVGRGLGKCGVGQRAPSPCAPSPIPRNGVGGGPLPSSSPSPCAALAGRGAHKPSPWEPAGPWDPPHLRPV